MKHDAIGGRPDGGLKVDGRAPLLVHDAHLKQYCAAATDGLDAREQRFGHGDFVRAMHLCLDDIDQIAVVAFHLSAGLDLVPGDQDTDDRIENAFRRLLAPGVKHRIGIHMDADIADQHQCCVREDAASSLSAS